ncbi:hypothetical protein BD410DRAFT_536833 [Rickenella mellea]|uniref:Uncharacterized protein n=1 Tax=Rickenella mellea TaxID=50990 RepID=A0A4Y7PTA3_9AGAM|nr:hypothetical protein BD410DRAFT_536833 [Rickenella mellea]
MLRSFADREYLSRFVLLFPRPRGISPQSYIDSHHARLSRRLHTLPCLVLKFVFRRLHLDSRDLLRSTTYGGHENQQLFEAYLMRRERRAANHRRSIIFLEPPFVNILQPDFGNSILKPAFEFIPSLSHSLLYTITCDIYDARELELLSTASIIISDSCTFNNTQAFAACESDSPSIHRFDTLDIATSDLSCLDLDPFGIMFIHPSNRSC